MPKAASLAEEIKASLGIEAELIGGGGGCFDIHADGKLIYSKQQSDNEFPEHSVVIQGISAAGQDSAT